ncbi:hypothetical protein GCM10022200_05460 [Microbacterium awajiense]|uniref:ComEC/Rec2-related protein domain-containing protein n=1 Tax=Microbacterium awajiense TaxID=415214 RepID=A0ABP7A6Z3_9MICO
MSGANCALVVGLVFVAASALGARRALRVAGAAAALAGFVVLVTPEPSVVRAATMSTIAMVAVLLGRPGAGLALLALATAVVIVADPWLASSIGFALSVAATGALLVLSRPLAAGLARGMPRALALTLAVPLAAQLACGPLIVLIEPSVAVYGVVANALAAPAAPAATVLGLAACLAAPVPLLQAGLTALAWLPASWIAQTALVAAALPGAALPWLAGGPGVATLAVLGGAIAVLVVAPRSRRRLRLLAAAFTAVAAGVALGGGLLGGPAAPWTLPAAWAIVACDVGQGDANRNGLHVSPGVLG